MNPLIDAPIPIACIFSICICLCVYRVPTVVLFVVCVDGSSGDLAPQASQAHYDPQPRATTTTTTP